MWCCRVQLGEERTRGCARRNVRVAEIRGEMRCSAGLYADGRPIAAATNARQVGVQHSPAFYDVTIGAEEET